MAWNGFCAMKEHSKRISCWLHFFHLNSIGVETYKTFEFFEKKFQNFLKSAQKWFFCWLQFVQPSRVGKTQVLKWSAITQRTVRSSFLLTILCKMCCMLWKACLYFLYTIATLNVSILLSMCVRLKMFKKEFLKYELINEWNERTKI